ncbi:uncharacterized protein LOC135503381 [Lineus longissimus]|uniref:uncharacterized protein LOC135503381 n=1 Tax=Lineus longissimus TaxID=88925 RepID=UPI00315C7261
MDTESAVASSSVQPADALENPADGTEGQSLKSDIHVNVGHEGGVGDVQYPMKIQSASGGEGDGSSSETDLLIKGRHFLPGNGGSTPSTETTSGNNDARDILDITWAPTPAPKNFELATLNRFLQQGGCAPVEGQLQTAIDEASQRTIRYYKSKAKEAFGLVLHLLAPGQEDELMALVQPVPSNIDDSLAATVIKCYDEANTWFTKRQILSILAVNRTKSQIDQARKHARDVGQAQPVPLEPITRSRLDNVKVDHFLDFISRPEFVQDVAYGTRTMKLSNGEKIEIPNIVRTTIVSRVVQLYQAYCEETDFHPLQRSTLFSIIQVCAASQKKSLAGLDNIAAEGSQAFDSLIHVVEQLGECGYSATTVEALKSKIQSARMYLKTDYKLHISEASQCPDHCIVYALAESTSACKHDHDMSCERCKEIVFIFETIELAFRDLPLDNYRYSKQKDEIQFDFEAAKEKILQLKSHILRAKNQERAKTSLLQTLEPHQALLTMDWAMKFLPMKFREAQQDWFAKKGISWHVTASVSKIAESEYKIHCFVHLLDQCKQDWHSVYSVIDASLSKLMVESPQVTEVFLRSDNAGCYHNASLLLSLPVLSKSKGITIKRYDFSEAQAGKDICDRKIAPMKSHIQRYVNEGNDVTNAKQMRDALASYGGVRGCHVAIATLKAAPTSERGTWPGITSFTNFEFEDEGIRVWKAYGIGPGTFHSYNKLLKKCKQGPSGVIVGDYTKPAKVTGAMAGNLDPTQVVQVPCPENGCSKTFPTQEALTTHMACGVHDLLPLKDTRMDAIKRKWAGRVEAVGKPRDASSSLELQSALQMEDTDTQVSAGWAHRGQRTARRYSPEIRAFLEKEFMKGVGGMKENPVNVSSRIKAAFGKEDWLTSHQVMGYFSRLSTKQKCGRLPHGTQAAVVEESDAEFAVAAAAVTRRQLRDKVINQTGL